ncbi:MAG: hypothetical protein IAF38_01135 [Bacteroidia bacterium]|nr:hypothetical protein [Bacteroidia bacterium]
MLLQISTVCVFVFMIALFVAYRSGAFDEKMPEETKLSLTKDFANPIIPPDFIAAKVPAPNVMNTLPEKAPAPLPKKLSKREMKLLKEFMPSSKVSFVMPTELMSSSKSIFVFSPELMSSSKSMTLINPGPTLYEKILADRVMAAEAGKQLSIMSSSKSGAIFTPEKKETPRFKSNPPAYFKQK